MKYSGPPVCVTASTHRNAANGLVKHLWSIKPMAVVYELMNWVMNLFRPLLGPPLQGDQDHLSATFCPDYSQRIQFTDIIMCRAFRGHFSEGKSIEKVDSRVQFVERLPSLIKGVAGEQTLVQCRPTHLQD